MNCPNYHHPPTPTARFCLDCGTPLPPPATAESLRIGAITVDATSSSSVLQVGVPSPSHLSGEHFPICRAYSFPDNTFRCKRCGRGFICREHQDKATFWCSECHTAERARLEAERNLASIEWVEALVGPVLYGENRESVHIATPFRIGKYLVTQAQYQRFIDVNPTAEVPFVDEG